MPITTEHPEYTQQRPRWNAMDDALKDELAIKAMGDKYLQKTTGMVANDTKGVQFKAYISRARWPDITQQALTGILGLLFEAAPEGVTDTPLNRAGQANLALARDVTRPVCSRGREILVIDAPSEGGEPYIVRYEAADMINWDVAQDDPSSLTLAVFRERHKVQKPGDAYVHEFEDKFRVYERRDDGIYLTVFNSDQSVLVPQRRLAVPFMPIVVLGSINLTPAVDPIPLLPVAMCAYGYFRKSADYERALHRLAEPTPWVSGISPEQYTELLKQGTGASSLWYVGLEGQCGFLEASGDGLEESRTAMEAELRQAESYAVRLTQQAEGTESGTALAYRASAQHASLYTIADSISLGVTRAQSLRARWAAQSEPEPFVISAEMAPAVASAQMITALNNGVNSLNVPRATLFEALRQANLTTLGDEELREQIAADAPTLAPSDDDDLAA